MNLSTEGPQMLASGGLEPLHRNGPEKLFVGRKAILRLLARINGIQVRICRGIIVLGERQFFRNSDFHLLAGVALLRNVGQLLASELCHVECHRRV